MAEKGHGRGPPQGPQRLLVPPRQFDGRLEDYEEFSFKLKGYLSLQEPDFGRLMTRVETMEEAVTDAHCTEPGGGEVSERVFAMSRTLQYTLIMLCTGPALTIIRSVQTDNGFETWRQLHRRYSPNPMARQFGTLGQILEPVFNETTFLDDFIKWESDITKYERETATQLSDNVKIAVLDNKTSGEFQQHLSLNASRLNTYPEVRAVLVDYIKSMAAFPEDQLHSCDSDLQGACSRGSGCSLETKG